MISKISLIKLTKFWIPPIFWALIIFSFSSFTVGHATEIYWKDFIVKKTAHIFEYGIFATLLYRSMINSGIKNKKAMWLAVVIACLYGISDEFHQSFTPGREPTLRDVLIDTLGASIFIFAIIGNIKKMPQTLQNLYIKYQISLTGSNI